MSDALCDLLLNRNITNLNVTTSISKQTISFQASVDVHRLLPSSLSPIRESAYIRWRPSVSASSAKPASITMILPPIKSVLEALEAGVLRLRDVPAMIRLRGSRVLVLLLSIAVVGLGLGWVMLRRLLVLVRSWTAVAGLRWAIMGLVCSVILRSVPACSITAGLIAAR